MRPHQRFPASEIVGKLEYEKYFQQLFGNTIMKNKIKLGIYQHFKGTKVRVIGEALHSETKEPFVVYFHLEDNVNWVRPKEMFLEKVMINGKKIRRFEYLGK